MGTLRVRVGWAPNGTNGYLTDRSFPRQLVFYKNNDDLSITHDHHKPQQEITTSQRRRRLSVAAKLACGGSSMNTASSNSNNSSVSGLDRMISSYHLLTGRDGWTDIVDFPTKKKTDSVDKEAEFKKLDQWMSDSVVEIVRNIGEAPLLLHIYSGNESHESSSTASVNLVIEKAVADDSWPIIEGRWKGGSSPIPNGVILVEELNSEEVVGNAAREEEKRNDRCTNNESHNPSKTWGVLVQAKGLNRTACYILRTCQVQTLFGFCTHFCLARVSCFVENAETQLRKMWLVR